MSDNRLLLNALQNAFTSRQAWIQKAMGQPNRDIDKECGHPLELDTQDYTIAFERGDIANRVVATYPEETWANDPEVFEDDEENETEFEKAWKALQEDLGVYSMLERADILSGIGRYGVLLIGTDDGGGLETAISGIDEMGVADGTAKHKVLYLRPFDESLIQINKLQVDKRNPRYGQPVEYALSFLDTTQGMSQVVPTGVSTLVKVHWSRVIHLADYRRSSDVFGTPRMKVCFNRLLDLKKIAGGSGEMFWKGGFPGYALETQPAEKGETVTIDKKATAEEMDDYMNTLKRYIALEGLTIKNLSPQVADPTHHLETQIRLIAMAMAIPWRILMGVEVGQLAGEQDMRAWNRRLTRRREKYINPYILRPFVRRLIDIGALPKPQAIKISWPDLNTPGDKDRADVAEKKVNALSKYMQSGGDALIPPLHFLTLILGFDVPTAQAIIAAAESPSHTLDLTPPMVEAALAAAKNKPAPAAAPGR